MDISLVHLSWISPEKLKKSFLICAQQDTMILQQIWDNQCCIFSADVMYHWLVQAVLTCCLLTQVRETCTVHTQPACLSLTAKQLLFQGSSGLITKHRESCSVWPYSTVWQIIYCTSWQFPGPIKDECPCLGPLDPWVKQILFGEQETLLWVPFFRPHSWRQCFCRKKEVSLSVSLCVKIPW